MGRRFASRSQVGGLKCAVRSSISRSRTGAARHRVDLELLEDRRLLSVAPVAADDRYETGPDGKISVDVTTPSPIPEQPLPPLPAFDEGRFVEPAGPFGDPEVVRLVQGGQAVTESGSFTLGADAGTNQQVIVRDPGSRWTVSDSLEVAQRGRGSISVSNGGGAVVRNHTTVGSNGGVGGGGGVGLVEVSGAGSTWTSNNWMEIGYFNSWGTVRLLDHAAMTISGSPATATAGWIELGDNQNANGLLGVLDGSTLRHSDWIEVGDNSARGTLHVAGGGSMATANWAAVGDNHGLGNVSVAGANSRWTVGNWMEIGTNGGRGVVSLSDGGSLTAGSWVHVGGNDGSDGRLLVGDGSTFSYKDYMILGGSLSGTSRGTLDVGEGGRVITGGGQGFGQGPEIFTSSGGRILGSGSIQGKVTNGGFLSPGGSIGLLTIGGNFTQPSPTDGTSIGPGLRGTLQFDIGGTERGTTYDALNVTNAVRIAGGTVVLNFVNGYAPHAGDRFTLIDAASTTAAPQTVEVRGLAPGFQYTLSVENGDLILTANSDGTSAALPAVQRKGVLANDTDADGDALTAVLVKRPEHGTVTLFRDGSFSYAPGAGFAGTDSFQYVADDGVFESNVATVTLHAVQPPPVNQAPVAHDDAYSTDEDTRLVVSAAEGVLQNDTDDGLPAPPAALTAALVTGPSRGTLTLNPDGSFTYAPDHNFFGFDSFTYRAGDGSVQSDPATVRITVNPVNDAPTANDDHKTTRQGVALSFPGSDLTANDTDPDRGDTLTVTGVAGGPGAHGTVSLADGTVTYAPDRNFNGVATFTYTVSDGHGGTATGTVNVTVTPRKRGTPGTAAGRGTLNDRRQTFSFMILARSAGHGDELSIMGMLAFDDRAAGVVLRSTDITRFEVDGAGRKATISGSATVNGHAGYTFEATAEDKSASGSNDRFRIRITGPEGSGFKYDSAARDNDDKIDRGGNITIAGIRRKDDKDQ